MDKALEKLKEDNFISMKNTLDQVIEMGKLSEQKCKDWKALYYKKAKNYDVLDKDLTTSNHQFHKLTDLHDELSAKYIELLENKDSIPVVENFKREVGIGWKELYHKLEEEHGITQNHLKKSSKELKEVVILNEELNLEIKYLKGGIKRKEKLINQLNKSNDTLRKYLKTERTTFTEVYNESRNNSIVINETREDKAIKSTITYLTIAVTAKYWAPVLIWVIIILTALCIN